MTLNYGPNVKTHEVATTGIHGVGASTIDSVAARDAAIAAATVQVIVVGSYTGNGAGNRQIAHGLGRIPKFIMVVNYVTGATSGRINRYFVSGAEVSQYGVDNVLTTGLTAWDATNFTVSNLGNTNAVNYEFVAFG